MTEFTEARSRLRAANPVQSEDVPSPESPQAEALFERIVATELKTTRQRRVRWQRTWLLVPAALLAAAAGYGVFHGASQPLVVACFAQPSLDASRALAVRILHSGSNAQASVCGCVSDDRPSRGGC